MRVKRYKEEQIVGILKEFEAGISAQDLGRKYGVSDNTIYNWKAKYGGLVVSEVRRLKSLEDENRKLKNIVAEQALDNRALKSVISKNF